jgi:hypothetical protein
MNSTSTCSRLLHHREPKQPAVQRDGREREQRVRQCVLAQQRALMHVHRQAEEEGTPTPTRRGWCTAQNTSTSASRSGSRGCGPAAAC